MRKLLADAFILVYLIALVAVPASYYVRGGVDERFAWRMYSSIRLLRCAARLEERHADGSVEMVEPAGRELGISWRSALAAFNPRVVRRHLETRCRITGAQTISYARRCVSADDHELPIERDLFDCETSRWIEHAS